MKEEKKEEKKHVHFDPAEKEEKPKKEKKPKAQQEKVKVQKTTELTTQDTFGERKWEDSKTMKGKKEGGFSQEESDTLKVAVCDYVS
jgi:predicted RNA-binding protein with PIN domain